MSKQTTPTKILCKHLNRLKADQLEEFKKGLCATNPPQGTNKILNNQLKNKSAKEIAEIIIECYTIQKGPPHVVNVLKKINLNQKATDLQEELKQVGNPPKTSKAKTSTSLGNKIKDEKPTAETNVGVVANAKPTKKTTSKKQASDAIPGTSQNTGETSTKKKTPKRKLDQSEEQDQNNEQQPAKKPKHEGLSKLDLSKYLEELSDKSFKRFTTCLNNRAFLKPDPPIPKARLEKEDQLDVAGLMINVYTKEKAPIVTIKILKKIGEADLAKEMESKIGGK